MRAQARRFHLRDGATCLTAGRGKLRLKQAQGRSTSHSRFYHANACADLAYDWAYDADVDARPLLGVIGCQPT